MKIYSHTLTAQDVHHAVNGIDHVWIDDSGVRCFTARDGRKGFEVYLEGYGDRHTRARNLREGKAATWDDWGVFIERLFKIDPNAQIAHYNGRSNFIETTSRYQPTGARAPWLTEDVTGDYRWPDEKQREVDAARLKARGTKEVRDTIRSLRRQADSLERILEETR